MKSFACFVAFSLAAAVLVASPAYADRPGPGAHDRDGRPGPGPGPLHETPWEKWKNRHDADNRAHDRADGPRPWEQRRKDAREHSQPGRHEKRYPQPSDQSGYVWVEGNWNEREQWVPGYWKPKAAVAGLIWVPGEWDGSAWVRGFWRVAKKPGYFWVEGYVDAAGVWHVGHWQQREKH